MARRGESTRAPGADYEMRVVGAEKTPLRDFYHGLMRLSWPSTLLVIVAADLALNAAFATAFYGIGGVEHTRAWSWLDAFFFSVQTMGTIGYGGMAPASLGANALVVFESVVSLVFTALITGLVFAKFSRPSARVLFSREATMCLVDGVPTLAFRVGNQRANRIVEAKVRLAMVRSEITKEGKTFYRMIDLRLARDRILSLQRSWNVQHVVDEKSPLWGQTADSLAGQEVEFLISIVGIDDIWMQAVHATHRYKLADVAWSRRHVDVLREEPGALVLDLTRFHDTEPAD